MSVRALCWTHSHLEVILIFLIVVVISLAKEGMGNVDDEGIMYRYSLFHYHVCWV